jgi:hypothetical protein
MRYQCRLASLSAESDRQYAMCYNARRDKLEGFWGKEFGRSHAIMIAEAFFENVKRHKKEGRELAASEQEENFDSRIPTARPAGTCLWRASGRIGGKAMKNCYRSPRSPLNRQPKSPPPVMIAASFRLPKAI